MPSGAPGAALLALAPPDVSMSLAPSRFIGSGCERPSCGALGSASTDGWSTSSCLTCGGGAIVDDEALMVLESLKEVVFDDGSAWVEAWVAFGSDDMIAPYCRRIVAPVTVARLIRQVWIEGGRAPDAWGCTARLGMQE